MDHKSIDTLDLLLAGQQKNRDGSEVWCAVSDPKAVRNQPLMLFRFEADARVQAPRLFLQGTPLKFEPVTIAFRRD